MPALSTLYLHFCVVVMTVLMPVEEVLNEQEESKSSDKAGDRPMACHLQALREEVTKGQGDDYSGCECEEIRLYLRGYPAT